MFTKEELLERYKTVSLLTLEHLQIQLLSRSSHPSHISMESGCIIYRGSKKVFNDPVQFYCDCLIEWDAQGQTYESWKEGWRGWIYSGVDDALCRPLTFNGVIREFEKLGIGPLLEIGLPYKPSSTLVQIPPMDEFVAALQMSDEWNDIAILAEFKHEFIYVCWHTTA